MSERRLNMLSWPARLLLGVWAFIGTGLHAGSFAVLPGAERLLPIAVGIGISAGVSWLVVGVAVLALTRGERRRVANWFDTCLVAMGVGECLLVGAAGVNAAAGRLGIANEPDFMMGLHLGILIAADALMSAVFAWRACKSGEKLLTAAALWVVVLNGSFAVVLWALARPLGYGA